MEPCYDMVILNPKFIENNEYDRVTNKNIKKIKYSSDDDLLAVFELKLIENKSKTNRKQLEKDYASLTNAKEAKVKFMIVFSRIKEDQAFSDFFNTVEWNDNFKLVYTKVYFDNINKKHVEVLIKPNNFLNLSEKWLIKS